MDDTVLYYSKGYKYQSRQNFRMGLHYFFNQPNIVTEYITLVDGMLKIKKGYCNDGATWVKDTKNSMRAAYVHDALYQLIRQGYLPYECWKLADKEMYRILRMDGMSWFRAKVLWMNGLKIANGKAARKKSLKEILVAP